jgi:predicted acetyltransferase
VGTGTEIDYGLPANDGERDALGDLLAHAFGFPVADAGGWFERAKHENIRVVRHGGAVAAGLLEVPMGQFFGGRSVPTMGVAGVGVAPDHRGQGLGAAMMVAMLREAKTRGFALSTLYPASVTLYRRAGYERAGARFEVKLDPTTCTIDRASGVVISEIQGIPDEVVALYGAFARHRPGFLDRGPYLWSRVDRPRNMSPKIFAVRANAKEANATGVLEGYVAIAHTASSGTRPTTVTVTDLAATTARAAQAILRLLVEYRSLAGTVSWGGPPSDPFMNLLPERHFKVELDGYFMVRIVDVARALSERGFPASARGAVVFELADASMPESSGRYDVVVEGGRAKVGEPAHGASARAGVPVAALSERALAALYTGHVSPRDLQALGWLDAGEEALDRLATWFAGPLPSMRDHF